MRRNTYSDLHYVDLYEVAITLGAIFLVNYVTADSKTNFAEGFILVSFYFMIVSRICTRRASTYLSLSLLVSLWSEPS